MCPLLADCHDDSVTFTHIESARFHDAEAVPCGEGTRAIEGYLRANIGTDYTIVEVTRPDGRFSLIVESGWFRLAQHTAKRHPELLEDFELPRSCLLAVVAGWKRDWDNEPSGLSVQFSPDQIPHLRLTSLRPSPSGADGNAWRS